MERTTLRVARSTVASSFEWVEQPPEIRWLQSPPHGVVVLAIAAGDATAVWLLAVSSALFVILEALKWVTAGK